MKVYKYDKELKRSVVGRLDQRGIEIRKKILDTMVAAGRGHLASAFSLVEILATLYDHILKVDPSHLNGRDRDRLILSKGHGCLALYAILEDKGFISKPDLMSFCDIGSRLGGQDSPVVSGLPRPYVVLGVRLATMGRDSARVFPACGRPAFAFGGIGPRQRARFPLCALWPGPGCDRIGLPRSLPCDCGRQPLHLWWIWY